MRRLIYVTGTRADFGLLLGTLRLIQQEEHLDLSICVTGMHLSERFGMTINEIVSEGFEVTTRIPVDVESTSGLSMGRAVARQLDQMVDHFAAVRPDAVLLLGDRGEMLAGALAATYINIPVVHMHGGERSGSVDEPVRHSITKLAHYHFVATEEAKERVIKMGEEPNRVFCTGAPGIDGLTQLPDMDRKELCRSVGFSAERPIGLVVFHPVVQEAHLAAEQATMVLNCVRSVSLQVVWVLPNADAGGNQIREVLAQFDEPSSIVTITHIERPRFVAWMKAADLMIGNSSSGIIESASFGTHVVNLGSRQHGRERSDNVVDVERFDERSIVSALKKGLELGSNSVRNVYGDGRAGERIVRLLTQIPLGQSVVAKFNAY